MHDLTWHHHQVPGKMQLVIENIHGKVNHLGGNQLWGEARRIRSSYFGIMKGHGRRKLSWKRKG
nr:HNH endonuclease [Fictibacillus macauensis]